MARGPNPVHCLFLYGLQAKDHLCIFKWFVGGKKSEKGDFFVTHESSNSCVYK